MMETSDDSVTALLERLDEIDRTCCRGITGNARAALVEIKGIAGEIRDIVGGFRICIAPHGK